MQHAWKILVLCGILLVFVLIWNIWSNWGAGNDFAHNENNRMIATNLQNAIDEAWRAEGKDDTELLSKRLNILARELNRVLCRLKNDDTTSTGGWCSRTFQVGHICDEPFANELAKFLKNQSVASFGEGPGSYRKIILASGLVKQYDGYDGSPFIDIDTEGDVQYLDLTIPQYGLPLYDWTISLEVAEHIPQQFEHIFLDNILRHTKKGVILSWSIIGQEGIGHVNNRRLDYVLKKMKSLCFINDKKLSATVKGMASFLHLQRNIQVQSEYKYIRNFNEPHHHTRYTSGGAGYVLSLAALSAFAKKVDTDAKTDMIPGTMANGRKNLTCGPEVDWMPGDNEDVHMSNFLNRAGVKLIDTQSANGGLRFLSNSLVHLVHPPSFDKSEWLKKYGKKLRQGIKRCCDRKLISIHYTTPEMMYVYEFLMYQFELAK